MPQQVRVARRAVSPESQIESRAEQGHSTLENPQSRRLWAVEDRVGPTVDLLSMVFLHRLVVSCVLLYCSLVRQGHLEILNPVGLA